MSRDRQTSTAALSNVDMTPCHCLLLFQVALCSPVAHSTQLNLAHTTHHLDHPHHLPTPLLQTDHVSATGADAPCPHGQAADDQPAIVSKCSSRSPLNTIRAAVTCVALSISALHVIPVVLVCSLPAACFRWRGGRRSDGYWYRVRVERVGGSARHAGRQSPIAARRQSRYGSLSTRQRRTQRQTVSRSAPRCGAKIRFHQRPQPGQTKTHIAKGRQCRAALIF